MITSTDISSRAFVVKLVINLTQWSRLLQQLRVRYRYSPALFTYLVLSKVNVKYFWGFPVICKCTKRKCGSLSKFIFRQG